jgi:hypothetical protein
MKSTTRLILVLFLLMSACSSPDSTAQETAITITRPSTVTMQTARPPENAPTSATPSSTATTFPTINNPVTTTKIPAPSSTPFPTPLGDQVPRGVQDVYRIMVEIEFNTHALHETAEKVNSGMVPEIDLVSAILAVGSLIGDVDDEIAAADSPPDWLRQDWQQALALHENTRSIVNDWAGAKIDYTQVLDQTQPLVEQADATASGVEEKIAARYPVDLSVLRQFRQHVLMRVGELFLTPTPTDNQAAAAISCVG